jgi:hypothetical protein
MWAKMRLTTGSASCSLNRLTVEGKIVKKNPQIEARVSALLTAPLDSWIALSDDETKITAHGASFQEVVDQLERLGDESSVILKTPPSWRPLAV